MADVSKGWFRNGHPQAVQGSAGDGVDLVLHPLGKSFLPLSVAAIGHQGQILNFESCWSNDWV